MSAYIPLIKQTRWIDLSPDHKKLRYELEQDTFKACIKKEQIQPIMLQGAFGIGKTNSLYYIFHYGWCKLKTPTFVVSLDEITKLVKVFASEQPNNKIQNGILGPFINKILLTQIEALKHEDWSNLDRIFFPEFNGGDLRNHLIDFNQVEVIEDTKALVTFNEKFSEKIILEAISLGNRPLLLIDEFESKFYELKKLIESSGGGVLRELFDQIVQDTNLFYLIIGNGPASGYEIAKERGDNNADSETAANRRLKTKPIPFPTSDLLKRSFLKDDPKGYINFIWWLSRCRPGHILKLRDSLGSIEDLKILNTNELITKYIFKESIDEGGEAVSYLKTQFFNELNGRVQAIILGKVLTEFQPIAFDVANLKDDLWDCTPYFLCSSGKINIDRDLIPVLRDDLYSIHLKAYQEDGKFDSVNYIEHLQPYFSYILSGISDSNGDLAFGMINDTKAAEVLASIFLIPLLELTYDFISLYQDDTLKETKESLDLLLKLINQIKLSEQNGKLELIVPNTFDKFEKCKLLRNNQVYLQLSLYAIRESIEQPIGSPKLKYKNDQIFEQYNNSDKIGSLPIIFAEEDNLHIYFIPSLPQRLLIQYLENLKDYLFERYYKVYQINGKIVIRVIYFEHTDNIEEFKIELNVNSDLNAPEPIYSLRKIDLVDFNSYQLNFEGQIKDFIDSVSQIGILASFKLENAILSQINPDSILRLKDIIKVIGDRPWTEKKETIRTIEHYRKLLFDGENSTFKTIHKVANNEYGSKLSEVVCNPDEFFNNVRDYSYLDKIIKDESESYDKFTSDLSLMYLFENKRINDNLRLLLELCKNEYHFELEKDNPIKAVNFKNLLSILTKHTKELDTHARIFDLSSNFIYKLSEFTKSLIWEDKIDSIDNFYTYLKDTCENYFITSYHNLLGDYSHPELSQTLYSFNYLRSLEISDLNLAVFTKLNEIEQRLKEVRVNILTKLDEIRIILDENQCISTYHEKLSKAIKGIALIKTIIDQEPNHTSLLIVYSIIVHFTETVNYSEEFLSQLNVIQSDLNSQKKKIDIFQEEIDTLYNDPLTMKLLGFKYPKKRTDNYLWKKNYLTDNLKNREEFEKLFGDSRLYNPFTRPTIFPDKLDSFKQCLIRITEKLDPTFIEMVDNMKDINKSADTTTQIKDFIDKLLIIEE